MNADSLTSPPTAYIGAIVGVLQYKKLPSLDCVKEDIRLIKTALSEAGYEVHPHHVLSNASNTLEFTNWLAALIGSAEPDSVIIAYCTGHGERVDEGSALFCLADYDPSSSLNPYAQSLTSTLDSQLELLCRQAAQEPRLIVIFHDACNRPGVAMKGQSSYRTATVKRDVNLPEIRIAFVYAASPGQLAHYAKDGPSHFAKALATIASEGHPTTTFKDMPDALNDLLNQLVTQHNHPEQTIGYKLPDDIHILELPLFPSSDKPLFSSRSAVHPRKREARFPFKTMDAEGGEIIVGFEASKTGMITDHQADEVLKRLVDKLVDALQ